MRKLLLILLSFIISIPVYCFMPTQDEPDTRIINDSPTAYSRKDRVRSNNYFTGTYTSLTKLISKKEDKNHLNGRKINEPEKDKYVYYDGTDYIHKSASGGGGIKKLQGCDKEEIFIKHDPDVDIKKTFEKFEFWWHEGTGDIYFRVPVVSELNSLVKYGVVSHDDFVILLDKYTKQEINEGFASKPELKKTNDEVKILEDNLIITDQKVLNNIEDINNLKTNKQNNLAFDDNENHFLNGKNKFEPISNIGRDNNARAEIGKIKTGKPEDWEKDSPSLLVMENEIKAKQDKLDFNGKEDYYLNGNNQFKQISGKGILSLYGYGHGSNDIWGGSQKLKFEVSEHVDSPEIFSDRANYVHYLRLPNAEKLGVGVVSHDFVVLAKSKAPWDVCASMVEAGEGLEKSTFEGKVKLSMKDHKRAIGKKVTLTAKYWGTEDDAPVDISIEQNGIELFKQNGKIETYLPVGGFTGHLKFPSQEIDEKVDMAVTADKDYSVSKHLCRVWVKMLDKNKKPLVGFDPICQVNIGSATKDYQLTETDFEGISRTSHHKDAKGTKIRFKALIYGKPHFSEWQTDLKKFPYSFTWNVDV